ncbi:fused MFS/spermidine synthase [Alcanivorax sp. JB21]|nr:fused MFS/spermidine synthase [Alcanivorax limicola]
MVELIIGVLGLVFHWVFVGALGLSYEVLIPALGQPWLVNSYKWILAGILILPQTVLLGMTFPLMTSGIIRRFPGRDGGILGGLYFTNSIGAAIGVLVAAFLLLPQIGLHGAIVVAGLINIMVALLAWLLSGGEERVRSEEIAGDGGQVASDGRRRLLRIALLATFMSGAASFAYEIVWIRMLSLAVGSTLHAFELMLASFIAGIAFGGYWIRHRADSTADPMRLVGWLQVWMGLAALMSLVLYANAFTWVGFFMESLSRSDGAYSLFNLGTASIAILIMMPAAFFAGTTLPLFTVALLRDGQGEASIGRVYAWNTLGAIVGVFAAIHFLIPVMGLRLTLIFAALIDMFIGVALLRWRADKRRSFIGVGSAAAVVVASASLVMVYVPFDPMQLSSGVYRHGQARLPAGDEVIYYRDGKTASVSAVASADGTFRIATNGKVDAGIQMIGGRQATADEPTMVLAAAIPLAYLDRPETVGVIGFGSGLTTHALLADPSLKRVDTIEIEEAMVEGARVFAHRVDRAYTDPRSNIIIDDAKSYFSGQQHRYDLIVSEPSNPWISGVGALFSKEFYEFVPRFMSEDGIFLQWLQLYEIDEALVGSVLNAMVPAFEDYHAYLANTSDLLIVASKKTLPKEPDFAKLFGGDMGLELQRVGIEHPEQMQFRMLADAELIEALARLHEHRVNSDYFPVLSLKAPKTRFRGQAAHQIFTLPVLDVPLLEALGISGPVPSHISPGIGSHYPRAMRTDAARLLARALKGQELGDHGTEATRVEISRSALMFESLAMKCQASWRHEEELLAVSMLRYLVENTLPFLSAEEQEGVLIAPAWQACNNPPAAYAEIMELLEAAASRDDESTELLARDWLDGAGERDAAYQVFDAVAFSQLQFALIRQGKLIEAAAVEKDFGAKVQAKGEYGLARTLLLAWFDRS